MIRINEERLQVEGNKVSVMSELATMFESLLDDKVLSRENIAEIMLAVEYVGGHKGLIEDIYKHSQAFVSIRNLTDIFNGLDKLEEEIKKYKEEENKQKRGRKTKNKKS